MNCRVLDEVKRFETSYLEANKFSYDKILTKRSNIYSAFLYKFKDNEFQLILSNLTDKMNLVADVKYILRKLFARWIPVQ